MKDIHNLLSHNLWSCGDYLESLDEFTRTQSSILTNQYSSLGEHSIKIQRTSSTWWINIPSEISTTGTYTWEIDVLNHNQSNVSLMFLSNSSTVSSVTVPYCENWQTITIIGQIDTVTTYSLRVLVYDNDGVFIDNVKLVKN